VGVTHADAFRLLGLAPGASLAAIRSAHDQLAAQLPSDDPRRGELAQALALFVPPAPLVTHVEPGIEIPWHAGKGPLPMPGAPTPQSADAQRAHRRSLGIRNMVIGGALALVGILITAGTHEAAVSGGGGTYLIMYGPIIGGGLMFVQGLVQTASR